MRLRRPTDFLLLEALAERGRNVAPNLTHHTGKSRKNINTRLPVLDDYGLVDKVGPAESSGLYELTELGEAALAHRDSYGQVDDFEALIEGAEADAAPSQKPTPADRARTDGGNCLARTDADGAESD
ncbi:ArsR family transcriptional regulator [Halovivax sp.]|uniref:ArsR family transcriptional regulator n=1 Tax=Halovivax sp. TaxID=1935978 RepID=UPI0025C738B6|nr:ArsR family transcriptional regulator [Halovivax sp.]